MHSWQEQLLVSGMHRRTNPLASLMNPARYSYIGAHNPRLLRLGNVENEYPDRASRCRATAGPLVLASLRFSVLAPGRPRYRGALRFGWEAVMTTQLARVTQSMPAEVIEHLERHHVITVSTSSFTGMPHADTVVYMNDANTIFFLAVEGTHMLRNINDSRYVSFTVDDYTVDWRKVRELQGVGRCRPATEEQAAVASSLYLSKFGQMPVRPSGLLHAITPGEVHFVDYDYATVTGQALQIRRTYQIQDTPPPPSQGAVSTMLDRLTYEPGQMVFSPGDSTGEYYVVIDGEVEICAEGYGADQTVVRLGPGQFFGDQAALRGQKGALTCYAVTRSILFAVDRTSLRDLLHSGLI
jgi:uncharacterized protein YhbP (UPF0306 family)